MFKRIPALLLAAALIFGLAGITLASTPVSSEQQNEPNTVQESMQSPTPEVKIEPPEPPEFFETLAPDGASEPDGAEQPSDAAGEPEQTQQPQEPEEPDSNFYLNERPISGVVLKTVEGKLYAGAEAFFAGALTEAEAVWTDGETTVRGKTASGEALSVTARPGNSYIVANGRYLYVPSGVVREGETTLVPLETLLAVFPGSTLAEGSNDERAEATLSSALLTSGEAFYDAESVDLIARVIYNEACWEPFQGKVALANLIMNRVNDRHFPNNVRDVLYAKGQFTVVKRSSFWSLTPDESCYTAAKLAMDGAEVVPGAVYYCTKGLKSWISRNCPLLYTINNHDFYGV